MNVTIEKPEKGWIKFEIIENEKSFTESFSHTPEDFISKLIEVLNIVKNSEGEYSFCCYSEPNEYDLQFIAEVDELEFKVNFSSDVVFQVKGEKRYILSKFIRELSKIYNSGNNKYYNENWDYEFPEKSYQKLKSYLKQN